MYKAYLKIKIVSLADEAVRIRRAEDKIKWKTVDGERVRRRRTETQSEIFIGLKEHRRGIVRSESRAAHLAFAYLSGKGYRELEADPKTEPNWSRVSELVTKYGKKSNVNTSRSALEAWYRVPVLEVPKTFRPKKVWDGVKKAARSG